MSRQTSARVIDAVRDSAIPLAAAGESSDAILDLVGDARFVLLGEASHGTHEFYAHRAAITKRLIREKHFTLIAVEADWPDAYRINRYVRATGADQTAIEALADFQRFPTWMWRNADVLDFIGWLREHNDDRPRGADAVGFYGLDLYSLFASMESVIRYLEKVDPDGAARARSRYSCFDHFANDPQAYGYASTYGVESCEEAVVRQLVDLQRHAADYARRDGAVAEDELFFAEQNARLAINAEEYYRSMFRGRASSWNLRDMHMVESLDALVEHFDRRGHRAKVVVWEHNSHLGDARATEMSRRGELNVGQLVRQRRGRDAVLIGFTTYAGTVTAASNWDAPAERKRVRPALRESYEALLHETTIPRFLLPLGSGPAVDALRAERLERAIGVIYLPDTERASHYFAARLPEQFDAVIHFDETRAVEPLERTAEWHAGEAPETYPFGV